MGDQSSNQDGPVVVKKYANRRLYNTKTSSYITLENLAEMVRSDIDFQVVDARTGDDITHSILTQIIMEAEANGNEQMLPVNFLRELIGMYGNSMQAVMPDYLDTAMEAFRENQSKFKDAFEKGIANTPIAAIHETNLAMVRAATEAFIPNVSKRENQTKETQTSEIEELRKQMAQMQEKLDKLGQ